MLGLNSMHGKGEAGDTVSIYAQEGYVSSAW